MIAIVHLSWGYSIAVPVAKLSAVLAALTEYPRVDSAYLDGREQYYLTAKQDAPRVTLVAALDPAPKTDEE
jgi:hypothetical protein